MKNLWLQMQKVGSGMPPLLHLVLFLLPLVCVCQPAAGQTDESRIVLQLESGKAVDANLLEIKDGSAVFQRADSEAFEESFSSISRIEFGQFAPKDVSHFQIQLRDGSELRAKEIAVTDGNWDVLLGCGSPVQIRAREVHWAKFKNHDTNVELIEEWRVIVGDSSRTSDAVIVQRDGELEAVEGVLGDLQDQKVGFSIEDRSANIGLEKLDGLVYYRAASDQLSTPVCKAQLTDGSLILFQQIGWANNQLFGTTVSGVKLQFERASLAIVDFAMGRSIYLDSMDPATNDWKPLLTSSSALERLKQLNRARANRAFSGAPLSLAIVEDQQDYQRTLVKQFEHGYALRAGSKLAFRFDKQYAKLTGLVGFDPAANQNGNLLFTVRADGKVIVEEHLKKREMSSPLSLEFDVSGVDRIVFQVDYQDGRSVGDQLHMVDLKVAK